MMGRLNDEKQRINVLGNKTTRLYYIYEKVKEKTDPDEIISKIISV